MAQSIEFDLGRALIARAIVERHPAAVSGQSVFDAFRDAIRKKPLGPLMGDFRKSYNVLGDVDETLEKVLATRNDLMHRFFSAHIDNLETDVGRAAMIRDLEEIQRTLWQGHQLARALADYFVERLEDTTA
jgi:hypothetical protein